MAPLSLPLLCLLPLLLFLPVELGALDTRAGAGRSGQQGPAGGDVREGAGPGRSPNAAVTPSLAAGAGRWVQQGPAGEDLRAGPSSFGPTWPSQDSSQYSPWLVELGGRLVMYYCKNIQMEQAGTKINRDRVHRVERASDGSWGASTVAIQGTNTTAPDDLSCSPGVVTVGGVHHMFYVGAARAHGLTLFLLHAVSTDTHGLNWTKLGLVGGKWPQPFPGYFETPTPIFDDSECSPACVTLYVPGNLHGDRGERQRSTSTSGVFVSRDYSYSTATNEFSAPIFVPSSPPGSQAGRVILPQPACMSSAVAAGAAALYIYSTSVKGAPPTTVSIATGASMTALGRGAELFGVGSNGSWDGSRVWSPTATWVPSASGDGCSLWVYYAGNVGSYRWWGANTSIGHRQFSWVPGRPNPNDAGGLTKLRAPPAAQTDDDDVHHAGQHRPRLFVHYDYYLAGTSVDKFSNNTLELLVPGAENVIASWSGGPAHASPWSAAGGTFAWVMPRTNRDYSLEAHLGLGNFSFGVDSAVLFATSFLRPKSPKTAADFKYIALDELGIMPAEWQNGGNMAARFVGFLERLAEEGYDRRLITYVNAYNMGNGTAEIGQYSDILRACVKHCRAIGLEVYLYTEYVFKPGPEPVGKCFHNVSCLVSLAHEFEAVAPGLNAIAFTTLGVSDVYLQNSTDALCDTPLDGALRLQVQALLDDKLTATQQGLGTYTLMRASFHQVKHARCLRSLENSWPCHSTTTHEESVST